MDLRSMIAWSASGLAFNELSLRAFDGVLRVDGSIASVGDNSKIFELSTQAQGLAASALAKRLIPTGADKFQGRIDGQGRFVMTASDGNDSEMALKGIADTTVRQGVIKGFNLLGQLLLRGSDITLSAQAPARFSPGLTALLTQPDTVFESIKAKFIVEPERIRTDNLVIATADYTITGAGWIGFDRSSSWNGLIVLSPKVTREVQKDYRVIRYLLDRRGRLSITFRVEGTVPNVKIRLDNRAFAQSLRGGVTARDQNAEAPRQPNDASRDHKRWLPDALERFLNR